MPTSSQDMTIPIKVAILSLRESGTMAAFGLHELLGAARDATAAAFNVQLVSRGARPFEASTGLLVTPQSGLSDDIADVVIICDIHLEITDLPESRWHDEIAWVQRHVDQGALVCATCSGSVLLAEAGLLDGADAASHWLMADLFRDRYPKVRFRPERILCDSGRGGRLVTTGGASAWQDLALYLIARLCGASEAARIARLFLLGDRGLGQLPFASMARPRQHNDAVVGKVQVWLADNYATPNPVSAIIEQSGLPERSLKRRFKAATGYSPIDYVQALRIEEAKQMLETQAEAVEAIGASVGYEDPTFFRKLFKRRTGVTPAQYRLRNRIRGTL